MADLFAPWDENARYEMRGPCRACDGTLGYITPTNGQDVVRCLPPCDTFQYNAPRTETGREQRSVSTRPNIKPKQRWRVLERDGHKCVYCGTRDNLHVDHLISRADAEAHGVEADLIDSDHNLAAVCEECNLGKGADSLDLRMMCWLLRIRAKQRPA